MIKTKNFGRLRKWKKGRLDLKTGEHWVSFDGETWVPGAEMGTVES